MGGPVASASGHNQKEHETHSNETINNESAMRTEPISPRRNDVDDPAEP
ncbi:hypothetical protein AWU68_1446 [Corynebacterium simulans]|nr:hypothetical protein AWU68_1446 [Corynebacterium simulans]